MSQNVSQTCLKCVKIDTFRQKVTSFVKPRDIKQCMEMIDLNLTFTKTRISALFETFRHI